MRGSKSKIVARLVLSVGALVTALGGPSAASAVVAPHSVAPSTSVAPPVGVEASTVSFAFRNCVFGPFVNQPFGFVLRATYDSVDGPGQEFELTNVSASLAVPHYTVSGFYSLGARTMNMQFSTLNLNVGNATPATMNLAGSGVSDPSEAIGIENILHGLPFPIPTTGSTSVGPFAASSGGKVRITVGAISGSWGVFGTGGTMILVSQSFTCPAPSPPVRLATISIGGTGAGLNAPGPYTFSSPVLAPQQALGTATANLACSAPGIPSAPYAVTDNVTGPTVMRPGASASLTGSGQIAIPAKSVNALIARGASSLSGSITGLNLNVSDASPSVLNLAATPIAFGPLPLIADTPLVIATPATSTLSGSVTATGPGRSTISYGFGSETASITYQSSGGSTVGTGTLSCAAPSSDAIIGTIAVK